MSLSTFAFRSAAHSRAAAMVKAGYRPRDSLTTSPLDKRRLYRQVFRPLAPALIHRPGVWGSMRYPSTSASTLAGVSITRLTIFRLQVGFPSPKLGHKLGHKSALHG